VYLSEIVSNQKSPVKPGQSVELTITIEKSAPPSGTRVFFFVDRPALLDPTTPVAPYIDFVPAGDTKQAITLRIAPGIKATDTLTLTAHAGGPAKSVTISITPEQPARSNDLGEATHY
jgi:hypothetical protein